MATSPVDGAWHATTATLRLLSHPNEDVGVLGGLWADEASVAWPGIAVAGTLDA